MSGSSAEFGRPRIGNSNEVFKSGPLLISSKALGWKSWKKRWFVLTRMSLVYFKSDPSLPLTHDGESNVTLGGIDLNNSGSVVIREDRKLITILFPDGLDGRAFTLKAETTQDMHEWKFALHLALERAPKAALVMGSNGLSTSDSSIEGPFCRWGCKRHEKSVVGCSISLVLENDDGSPSFLEKAVRFIEIYGVRTEGILRLSADVEEVHKRIIDYKQGNTEFHPNEDAHVIGDCVKYVLRKLPSSPVPASCCSALVAASRVARKEARINAMCSAVHELLPEPNRRLLCRILEMMCTISFHSDENRMVPTAIAACMAPLLLRPLFSGDSESGNSYSMNGDTSALLIAAANAANNAHLILTTLLEEYKSIFNGNENQHNGGSEITIDDRDLETGSDCNWVGSIRFSEISTLSMSNPYDCKPNGSHHLHPGSSPLNLTLALKVDTKLETTALNQSSISIIEQIDQWKTTHEVTMYVSADELADEYQESPRDALSFSHRQPYQSTRRLDTFAENSTPILPQKLSDISALEIQRLEKAKNELQQRIANEVRHNEMLYASLDKKRQALLGRRVALEQDVARLHAQLDAERDLRTALQNGLNIHSSAARVPIFQEMDTKAMSKIEEIAFAEADVAKLKQKVSELYNQLRIQRHQHPHESQQQYIHQDFNSKRGARKHERKRVEEFLGPRNIKVRPPPSPGSSGRTSTRSNAASSPSPRSFMGEFDTPSTAHLAHPSRGSELMDYRGNPSTTLVKLTSKLNSFKERRAQLMEQLHMVDLKKNAP